MFIPGQINYLETAFHATSSVTVSELLMENKQPLRYPHSSEQKKKTHEHPWVTDKWILKPIFATGISHFYDKCYFMNTVWLGKRNLWHQLLSYTLQSLLFKVLFLVWKCPFVASRALGLGMLIRFQVHYFDPNRHLMKSNRFLWNLVQTFIIECSGDFQRKQVETMTSHNSSSTV